MDIFPRASIPTAQWDAFCDAHTGAWWWWRSEWLNYQVARGGKEDLSFGIMRDGIIEGICPLFFEQGAFTVEGHPGPRPILLWRCESIQGELERILAKYKPRRAAFRCSPFDTFSPPSYRPVPDEGFTDISWHAQFIDLTQSREAIWRGLRKSYHSLIHRAEETHDILIDDQGELIRQFWELHVTCAGRETRPYRTWEMQAEWCKQGNGLIVAASLGGVVTAATYWLIYKRCAYYASSAAIHKDVTKALIWRAVLELKAGGVETLELGWIDYPGDPAGIGHFKQGFGGYTAPVVAVERRWE